MKNIIATFEGAEFAVDADGKDFVFLYTPGRLGDMMKGYHSGYKYRSFINAPVYPAVYRADLIAVQPDNHSSAFDLIFTSVPEVIYTSAHTSLLTIMKQALDTLTRGIPITTENSDYPAQLALLTLHNQRRIRKLDDCRTFVPMDVETLQTVELDTLDF